MFQVGACRAEVCWQQQFVRLTPRRTSPPSACTSTMSPTLNRSPDFRKLKCAGFLGVPPPPSAADICPGDQRLRQCTSCLLRLSRRPGKLCSQARAWNKGMAPDEPP